MGKENKFPEIIYLVDIDGDGIVENHVWSDDPEPAPGIDKKGSVAYRRIDEMDAGADVSRVRVVEDS